MQDFIGVYEKVWEGLRKRQQDAPPTLSQTFPNFLKPSQPSHKSPAITAPQSPASAEITGIFRGVGTFFSG